MTIDAIGRSICGAATALLAVCVSVTSANARQEAGSLAATMLSPANNAATAERVAVLVEQRYVFPPLGKRYAAAVRHRSAAGAYAAISDRNALAAAITADLQAVHPDGHLRLGLLTVETPQPSDAPSMTRAEALVRSGEVEPGIVAMRWLAPGIAYIKFHYFSDDPEAVAAVDKFLRDHATAKALIIDSRENGGGRQPLLAVFANRLFGTERKLVNMDIAAATVAEQGQPFPVDGRSMRRTAGPPGLVRFEQWTTPTEDAPKLFALPVYYLTSAKTFSAAEHMAFVFKITGRATLIGETTGGGNHFGGTEDVGSGLEMFVPIGRTSDPVTGRDWEGTGVTPDVAVPASRALDVTIARIRSRQK